MLRSSKKTFPSVYVFGQNSYGELGVGDTDDRLLPVAIPFFQDINVKQVAAGNEHTTVLSAEGQLYTFGFNGSGQLGYESPTNNTTPKLVESLLSKTINFLGPSNGCEHLIILSAAGEIYTCGYNNYGQLGQGNQTSLQIPTPLQALKDKKTIHASCSYYHSVYIVQPSSGVSEVYSVGRNENGQLGLGHESHIWIPRHITELPSIKILQTSCGLHHTLFLAENGVAYSSGFNDNGQLGVGDTRSRMTPVALEPFQNTVIKELSCGYYHSLFLTDAGDVYATGRNDKGQVGIVKAGSGCLKPQQIIDFHTYEENKFDEPAAEPSIISKNIKAIKIACGCYHSLVLSEQHELFTFGRGNHGQLGHGNIYECRTPKVVATLKKKKVIGIAGGFYHSVILLEDTEKSCFTLSQDLQKLVNSSIRADITFIIEEQHFHGHRCILFSRCRALDEQISREGRKTGEGDMYKYHTSSSNHWTLEMERISYSSFNVFMEYLYTDKISGIYPPTQLQTSTQNPLEIKFALDLLTLCDMYEVDRLKCICEKSIKQSMNIQNVAYTLRIAQERQSEGLKKYAMQYIMRNFGGVIGTQGFSELPQPILKEVLLSASQMGAKVDPTNKSKSPEHFPQ